MMKVSHQAQVTFYCLAFEVYLAEHAAAYSNVEFIASSEGGVWLPSDWSKPKLFNVDLVAPLMRELLFRKIPKLLLAESKEVKWHYNAKCQGCAFEETCRDNAVTEGRLSNIPHLTSSDHSFLTSVVALVHQERPKDIEDLAVAETPLQTLHSLLSSKSLLDVIKIKFPSTFAKLVKVLRTEERDGGSKTISPWLDSYMKPPEQPLLLKRPYLLFPPSEDVAVYFNFLVDPRSECLVAFSIASPTVDKAIHVVAPSRDHDMIARFVHEFNEFTRPLEGKRVQFIVFDGEERRQIQEVLPCGTNNLSLLLIFMFLSA